MQSAEIDNTPPSGASHGAAKRLPVIKRVFAMEALLGVLLASFWLFTLNNDAPTWYHPDERSKVDQVVGQSERNYRHPQLLLEASGLWVRLFRTPAHLQAYMNAGRDVSAAFGALTVISLAATAYLAFGWSGLLLAAITVGLCPSLLVYCHQMKEDAALAGGIGMVVFGTAVYWRFARTKFGPLFLAMLGICAAIAPSAKYVGVMSILCALPALAAPKLKGSAIPLRLLGFTGFFIGSWLTINHRIFDDLHRFSHALSQETHHAISGHEGVILPKPNELVFYTTADETPVHVWIFAAIFIGWLVRDAHRGGSNWFQKDGWQIIIVWFAIGCCAVLSFNTIPFRHYALPVIVLLYFLAAMGAARLLATLSQFGNRVNCLALPGLLIVFAGLQLPDCVSLTKGFGDDGRQHLRQWINDTLSSNAMIAENTFALLQCDPDRRSRYGQEKLSVDIRELFDPFCGARSTVPELRATGVEYVVACEADYEKYFLPFTEPVKGQEEDFNARKDFYTDLFKNYPLIWSWTPRPRTGTFNNPVIYVYRIAPDPR